MLIKDPFSAIMDPMKYITRLLEPTLRKHLARGKSILLLGPRQTGKSTLLGSVPAHLTVSFLLPPVRQRYERDPSLLVNEVGLLKEKVKGKPGSGKPLVLLDEVQRVPEMMDVVQHLIDQGLAQFILTGSSARKLRRGHVVNLLPGRLVTLRLDPLVRKEFILDDLERLLAYGSLPGIVTQEGEDAKEIDLKSYVENYLEEEVRAEALVRNVASFGRFLELAGLESGRLVSFRSISQEIGVSHTTIADYFQILVDCLIAERVDPITKSATRKKLIHSSRYLIFDMGVRRLCGREPIPVSPERWGDLLEYFIGLELIRLTRCLVPEVSLHFWKDADGPEVDWVLTKGDRYLPIEVKWSRHPGTREARHLHIFLEEYPQTKQGYIICRTPQPYRISPRIIALPWQQMETVLDTFD